MQIEVSNGEIIDKLTIIEIKLQRIHDKDKLANLKKEHMVLNEAAREIIDKDHELYKSLLNVNTELWDIEDKIRDLERNGSFGEGFIEVARSVYFKNDERAEIKRKINVLTNSDLIEEKSYQKYS